ncbi:hypothetical protein BRARA_H00607 [Brassica rapa]|uniref:DUF4283 domain-containing protein n=1 Tax=Brassica campestris TaxID=3711 RepID=A0A397Y8J9_BRACM|nr:hypothetical protein BRARA_H00607 [Brassica rapa]
MTQNSEFSSNANSLMGRLLNPECQPMAKMINYMPTAWRLHGRVRGINLSRYRFQFIFQREENLLTVLKYRPWSYNHWMMLLEPWTPNPQASFLTTLDTMYTLARKIGPVEELAYDPKVSQTKDYIRAKIYFNVEKPAVEAKNLIISQEEIHRICFSCMRLTHEKTQCPYMRMIQHNRGESSKEGNARIIPQNPTRMAAIEVSPRFLIMFPELSREDRQAAMQYISHADETERRDRILRVKQSIENATTEDNGLPIRISHDLHKDKGLVLGYEHHEDSSSESNVHCTKHVVSAPAVSRGRDERAEQLEVQSATSSFQIKGSTVFRLGNNTPFVFNDNPRSRRNDRKRPLAWVLRVRPNKSVPAIDAGEQDFSHMETGRSQERDQRKQTQTKKFCWLPV